MCYAQKKDSQSISPLKTINGKTAENVLGKAEALNDQFRSVFTNKILSLDKISILNFFQCYYIFSGCDGRKNIIEEII
jgi:hypothetical protein